METLLKVIAIHVVFCFGLPSASLGSLLLTSRTVYNDATVQPGAYGLEIVKATVAKIDSTCVFQKDKLMVRVAAILASNNGEDVRPGFRGGIWQVDEAVFNATKAASLSALWSRFSAAYGIDWLSVEWSDLNKPLYSALAARLALAAVVSEGVVTSLGGPLPWNLDEQSKVWARAFQKSEEQSFLQPLYRQAAQKLRSSSGCKSVGADIAFVVDGSGSVGANDFAESLNFVTKVVDQLDVGADRNRIAFLDYSSGNNIAFYLDSGYDKNTIKAKIMSVWYQNGGTNTHLALEALHKTVFTPAAGGRPGSRPQLAVLLTDGASAYPQATLTEAANVHASNIILLSVGVTAGIYEWEVKEMASEPKCQNVYHLQNFNDMAGSFALEIEERSCEAPAIVKPLPVDPETQLLPPPIPIVLHPGQVQHFCFVANTQQGATIILNGTTGTLTVYLSLTTNRPNEQNYDRKISVRAGEVKTEYLTHAVITSFVGDLILKVEVCLSLEGSPAVGIPLESGLSNINDSTGQVSLDYWTTGITDEAPLYPASTGTTSEPMEENSGSLNIVEGIANCGSAEYFLSDGEVLVISSAEFASTAGGNVTAPGYKKNLNCVWTFHVPAWTHLEITVDFLNLLPNRLVAAGRNCKGQDRAVIARLNGGAAEVNGNLCGYRTPGLVINSSTKDTTLTFATGTSAGPGYGFSLRFRAVAKHLLDCSPNGMRLELRKEYLSEEMPLAQYTFGDPTCGNAQSGGNAIYMETGYGNCGTASELSEDHMRFSNVIVAEASNVPCLKKPCKKIPPVLIPFRCTLERKVEPLTGSYESLRSRAAPVIPFLEGIIQLTTGLNIYHDANFDPESEAVIDFYDLSGDNIYIEVAIRDGANSPFIAQANQCWATHTSDKNHPIRDNFIVSGCPVDDRWGFQRHWAESWEDRFSVNAMEFDSDSDKLYFHCVVRICVKGVDEHLCSKTCEDAPSYRTFMRAVRSEQKPAIRRVAQFGPVSMKKTV